MTINEGMVLQKAVRSRMNDLVNIRNANLVSRRTFDIYRDGAEKERTEITPQYDPKLVDTKVVELEMFLFKLDTAIKRANSRSEIEIVADVDKLLAPIQ